MSTDQAVRNDVPGRTLGFVLMSLMIIFAGVWLQQHQPANMPMDTPDPQSTIQGSVAFDASSWFLPADDLLGFVHIAPGNFTMGSNPALDSMAYENERWSSTRRQGSVDLPEYYIGRYEVTVAQFKAYAQDTGANVPAESISQPGDIPITNITWAEAMSYARWLEQQLRMSDNTPQAIRDFLDRGAQVSLPSEAEWEKAARGADSRIFPWGSEQTSQFANFGSNTIAVVGSKPCASCSYGLSDMSGNVWELTRSPLQDYPYDPADDFTDLSSDPIFVMRGGSYADSINNVRAATRGGVEPGVRNPTIGFRVVIATR